MRYKLALTGAAALAAFLLATNPVVVHAAKQVTGAGIRNNSITGIDIRNNSLTGADVATNGLTGSDVKDGTLTAGDLPVVVAGATHEGTALSGKTGQHTVLGTQIKVPTTGYLVISASADVYNEGAEAFSDCWISVDGKPVVGSGRKSSLSDTDREDNCDTDVTVRVSAGTHSVALVANVNDPAIHYDETAVNVIFAPFGTTKLVEGPPSRPGRLR